MADLAPAAPAPSRHTKRRGRKRPNVVFWLPPVIFMTFRALGVLDRDVSRATGIPHATVTRISAGISSELGVSREEFAKLEAFARERLELASKAVEALLCVSVV